MLLATVFLHLLPETRYYLHLATSHGYLPNVPYPLGELIICAGFFFIYIIEEVVHSCLHNGQAHHLHSPIPPQQKDSLAMTANVTYETKGKMPSYDDDHSRDKFMDSEDDPDVGEIMGSSPALDKGLSLMRAVVVVVALSVHSIMEGMALGLVHQQNDVWMLFAALSAHKLIIAFCVSMELIEVGVSMAAFFASMIIFSLASPVGGIIGTLVVSLTTETTATGVLLPTFLQGLSAGTILYVTFCEVLERERARPGSGIVRMLSFLGGFVLMAALQVLDTYVSEDSALDIPSPVICKGTVTPTLPYTEEPYNFTTLL